MITLVEALTPDDIAQVRALFEEYAHSLDVDLGYQGFASELAALPGRYSRPTGTLLLARMDTRSVGCVAVHAWQPPDIAELKRLYVSPDARGQRVGPILLQGALDFARSAGYREVWLDTHPSMTAARSLYAARGFREIAPYRESPVAGTSYFAIDLEASDGERSRADRGK